MSELTVEYGEALSALAFEEHREDELLAQVRALIAVFDENPDYIRFLSAPNIPRAERLAAIDEAFSGFDVYLRSFLKMLTERGYALDMKECLSEYEALYFKNKNISVAEVTSAVALTEEQKEKLKKRLEKKLGKQLELKCAVTPELLGGIRVYVDGELFDGSIKGKLENIRETLADTSV